MSAHPLRFSLRGLFILTTVVAVLVGLGVRFPIFGEICLMMIGPIGFTVAIAYLMNHYPMLLVRSVLVFFGTCFALVSVVGWMKLKAIHDEADWRSLAMLDAVALMFYYVAWSAQPNHRPESAVSQSAQNLQKQ